MYLLFCSIQMILAWNDLIYLFKMSGVIEEKAFEIHK